MKNVYNFRVMLIHWITKNGHQILEFNCSIIELSFDEPLIPISHTFLLRLYNFTVNDRDNS